MFDRLRVALQKRLEKISARSLELSAQPSVIDGLRAKGSEELQIGNFSKAESFYRSALDISAADAKSLISLGFVLKEQKRLVEARVYLQRAISVCGDDPLAYEAHYIFGLVAEQECNFEQARRSFRTALTLKPDFELACKDLCRNLFFGRKMEEAQVVLLRGLDLNPHNPIFHFYQGNIHFECQRLDLALSSYEQSVRLEPSDAAFHSALGVTQFRLGRKDQAMQSFRQAERLEPGSIRQAQYESGYYFMQGGEYLLAIENFEIAIEMNPEFLTAHSMLLFCLSFSRDNVSKYRNAAQRYGALTRKLAGPPRPPIKTPYDRASRKLRIGFVSGDFMTHPVGFFLESVLSNINRQNFHLLAYSNTKSSDLHTRKLRELFDEWNEIRNCSDETVCQMVRDHEVDILVDLSGHTGEGRIALFAWRPAPVQVSWLGYFASTGITEIDYILTDPTSIPAQSREYFSENIWYIPDTRLCMTPPDPQPKIDVLPPPMLTNGYVTFGSFQSRAKISQHVLSVWQSVLAAVPNSKLRLQIPQMDVPEFRAIMLNRINAAGIPQDRVNLIAGVPWEEYLASYRHVDILLDTFPYPGGTTTAEALWMGVPTVTMTGETMLSRQGHSLLQCVGLTNWVATSEINFVDLAIEFASDSSYLTQLRAELRERARRSALFDGQRFAANLESAFQDMFLTAD